MSESLEQSMLFQWAGLMTIQHPELSLMYAVPNGGYRTPKTAAILKHTGVKSGVPDICIPVPKGQYHGAYIELKTARGVVSANQKVWINALRAQGYFVSVAYGFDQAKDEIERYLGGT